MMLMPLRGNERVFYFVVLYVHQAKIYDNRCSLPTDTVARKYDREGIE
jgi:hypothetical protein